MATNRVQEMVQLLDAHDAELAEADAAMAAALPSGGGKVPRKRIDRALARLASLQREATALQARLQALEADRAALGGRDARLAGFTPKAVTRLRAAMQAFKARRRAWGQMRAAIGACRNTGRTPLFPFRDGRARALEQANTAIIEALDDFAQPKDQSAVSQAFGSYADISLRMNIFLEHMLAVNRVLLALGVPRPWRFLDIGCGCGVKVLAASGFVDEAVGLEYDPGYAAAARTMLAACAPDALVEQGDALAWDGYGGFEVIYFYRPMKADEPARAMEARVLAQARPGTVLVIPFYKTRSLIHETDTGRVDGAVFVAGYSDDDCAALRKRAERIGPDTLCTAIPIPEPLAGWRATIDACRAAGHDPLLGPPPLSW